ncbi:hypothetical protein GQ457_09G030990 [Hibiscus cannabinus]
MTTESGFVQPAIPKLDGHYDHWCMLMENFMKSKEYWNIIADGIPVVAEGSQLSEAQKKAFDEAILKDMKAKNYLFQAIDRTILETILNKATAKDIWDSLKTKYQGTARVQRAQRQALQKEYEVLCMTEGESVNDYFARTLTIVNKLRLNKAKIEDVDVVEKILRSMTPKFNYVVCSLEESKNLDVMTIDELQSSLLVHEQRMQSQIVEEQALKVATGEFSRGRGRGKAACVDEAELDIGVASTNPMLNATIAINLDISSMNVHARVLMKERIINHMCGKREFFSNLDENFREKVKLGDNSSMNVMGKGTVHILVNGSLHIITGVFYVPGLQNSLLSMGQLAEKGLEILIKHGFCKIYHPKKGLIIELPMSSNRMFKLYAVIQLKEETCFNSFIDDPARLWHCRYGHLSFNSLNLLQRKRMVKGLPYFETSSRICEDCLVGKQQRLPFPRKSTWRASQSLELVHTDICGPISPMSNSNKRQLTAAYTPQQNGVAERKNRTIMNMVRSMLSGKKIPKKFWPEAVNWTVHILNRCPTLAVKDKCPEEAWSGFTPSVTHFKVFGCVAHVHIPDCKRAKLDDKSRKCIFLGVSEESKAYRMYDPLSQKIIVSRDVVFEEDKSWEWDQSHKEDILVDLAWDDDEKESDKHYDEVTNDAGEGRETNDLNEEQLSNSSDNLSLEILVLEHDNHQLGCKIM